MNLASAAALSLLILSLAPITFAKGRTVKIAIKSEGITRDISAAEVAQFGVWEGPGVTINRVEQTEGFIIDWSKGIINAIPAGLQKYEVSFYAEGEPPALSYIVTYSYDPATQTGYVYLPGKSDKEVQYNRMWHGHGYEGNWMKATKAWDDFARPLISERPRDD